MSLISGEKEKLRDRWFYEHLFEHPQIPKSEGIRTEDFKYIRYLISEGNYEMLFNIKDDPLEHNNLATLKEYQNQLNKYRKLVEKYQSELA